MQANAGANMQQLRSIHWRAVLAIVLMIAVGGWKAWTTFGWVELPSLVANAAAGATVRIPRSQLAAHLDVRLKASHAETLTEAQGELKEWKARLLKRFDDEYMPEMRSVPSALTRNGKIFWDAIRNMSWADAEKIHHEEMQRLFDSKVGSNEKISKDLAETLGRIMDYSKSSMVRHLGKFSGQTENHLLARIVDPIVLNQSTSDHFQTDLGPEAIGKIRGQQQLAYFLLSKLTKYYTSKGDVLALGDVGRTCSLHPAVMKTCQGALSMSATVAREILKRAGIRIGATSAMAGPVAAALAVGMTGWEGYKVWLNFADHLQATAAGSRFAFAASLDRVVDDLSRSNGMLDQELSTLSVHIIAAGS